MKKWFNHHSCRKDTPDPKDPEIRSTDPEPVLLISAPSIWSAHVDSWLTERRIPYMKRGRLGAGVAIKVGPVHEIMDFYVPAEKLEEAQEDLEELKEIVGGW
ncbi:MAG TPA: hypothetical protein PKH23_04305 [Bacillota bacterium]|nr:hypothetical protein [Bacillota bacterium]